MTDIELWRRIYQNAVETAVIAQKILIESGNMRPSKRRVLNRDEAKAWHETVYTAITLVDTIESDNV